MQLLFCKQRLNPLNSKLFLLFTSIINFIDDKNTIINYFYIVHWYKKSLFLKLYRFYYNVVIILFLQLTQLIHKLIIYAFVDKVYKISENVIFNNTVMNIKTSLSCIEFQMSWILNLLLDLIHAYIKMHFKMHTLSTMNSNAYDNMLRSYANNWSKLCSMQIIDWRHHSALVTAHYCSFITKIFLLFIIENFS